MQDILCRLEPQKDAAYAAFSRKLCTTRYPMLGVRLPVLRTMAREICKEGWRKFLEEVQDRCYEEVMLEGMVLAGSKASLEEKLERTAAYMKKMDCWALTDSVAPTYRFKQEELSRVWEFFIPYLHRDAEFEVRFALVVLLDYFLTDGFIQDVVKLTTEVDHNGYYVNMARAWLLAEAAVSCPEIVLEILEQGILDPFTHKRTISKIRDSYRISREIKDKAAAFGRKR